MSPLMSAKRHYRSRKELGQFAVSRILVALAVVMAAPSQAAPFEATPSQAASSQKAPSQSTPSDSATSEAVSSHSAPSQVAPSQAAPSQTAPSHLVPSQVAPSHAAPSRAAPSHSAPSQAAPSHSAPSQAVPSQTAPSHSAPSQAAPSHSAPSQTAPSHSASSQAAPSQAAPSHSALSQAAPSHSAPSQAAPSRSYRMDRRQEVRAQDGAHTTSTAGRRLKQEPKFDCWSTPEGLPKFISDLAPCFSRDSRVLCRCGGHILDCSSNHGHLQFVPRMSGVSARVLNVSNNWLHHVDAGFLTNVTKDPVWLIDLYNNNMASLAPRVFSPFRNLTVLLLGGNRLSYEAIREAVFSAVPSLNRLDIKCGGLGVMPANYFNGTAAADLRSLDMSWNDVSSLDMAVLQPLRRLRDLTMWHNKMNLLRTAFMPFLQYVSFHRNFIADFPVTCVDGTNESLFPNLSVLDLNFNLIGEIKVPVCLPKLQVLNLQYNYIQKFVSDMFSAARFPALHKLELNQMEVKIRLIQPYAINNTNVKIINFALNTVDFSSDAISPDMFGGCHSVRSLFLFENNFERVSVAKFQRLVQHMPRLQELDVRSSGISRIDEAVFHGMTHLISLKLSFNQLFVLPDGVFDDLVGLQNVYVDGNHLTGISSQTFSAETQSRLRVLDLSNNPFQCTCLTVWLHNWIRKQPRLFWNYENQGYWCANVPNVTVPDFVITQQACLLDRATAHDVVIFTSSIVVVLLLYIAYRWRYWEVRQLWDEFLHGPRKQNDVRGNVVMIAPRYKYDVFMAFAEEDLDWVNELRTVLEDEYRLKVCFHPRDFIVGKFILDNIMDCIRDSRHLLMVFSPGFARSKWCQFELNHCQHAAVERDSGMVVVLLPGAVSRRATGAMMAVLRTTTYIEWPDEPGPGRAARDFFYGRLSLALNSV